MFKILIITYLFLIFKLFSCTINESKPILTLDEFFDYTKFPSLIFSPNGQHLLIHKNRPSWNSNSYENSLWLYEIKEQQKKLITSQFDASFRPRWSSNGKRILFSKEKISVTEKFKSHLYYRSLSENNLIREQIFYVYCIESDKLFPISLGYLIPTALAWSNNDSSFYIAAISLNLNQEDEWQDVIRYRDNKIIDGSIIYRIDFNIENQISSIQMNIVRHVPFQISDILYVPYDEQLFLVSIPFIFENPNDFEIFSINLQDEQSPEKLTNNYGYEANLKLSNDGKSVFFMLLPVSSIDGTVFTTQQRLYSIDVASRQIVHLAKDFEGNIEDYTVRPHGGVYILGQQGTNTFIYTQSSPMNYSILHQGWNGTYESLSSSTESSSLAFVYSAFGKPKEVYLVDNINDLQSAKAITNDNELFTQRDLPQAKIYRWTSSEDERNIEGVLYYPPGKFESKNLPLFVLIHGGPASASLNHFDVKSYSWAPMAASAGWLVLEPNYRGSIGYGQNFLDEIRYQPLSRPSRDILSGVDCLIKDGIANPNRLTVGGYSYGGFVTNWLITQTTRFNAALSGSGAIEHVSLWGTMDFPLLYNNLFGGFPWEVPHIYQNQAPIYYLDKVRTPTLIVTAEDDTNILPDQSRMLERGLYYRGIPVELLIFPNEGHTLNKNPWHGKIKVREELNWLEKYGHTTSNTINN
ncbi:unnamed protein product [Rotaria sp. Silwood2]|nr:unnamed protein product [Rotaria sp. Silwood2]CAF4289533.1 unnamed protein product [Rotaria sp. Silwood2]